MSGSSITLLSIMLFTAYILLVGIVLLMPKKVLAVIGSVFEFAFLLALGLLGLGLVLGVIALIFIYIVLPVLLLLFAGFVFITDFF